MPGIEFGKRLNLPDRRIDVADQPTVPLPAVRPDLSRMPTAPLDDPQRTQPIPLPPETGDTQPATPAVNPNPQSK